MTTPEYKADTGETWDFLQSKGYRQLVSIVESVGDRVWARENNLDYTSLWLILTGRRKPSFSKIRSCKNHVIPSDWFYRE